MARGTALSTLLARLRSRTGRSQTASSNADEDLKLRELLRSAQAFYYDDYDWPHLQTMKKIPMVANQRFYDVPSGMSIESIEGVAVKFGSDYFQIPNEITWDHYSQYDSVKQAPATGTVTITAGTSSPGVNKINSITIDGVDVLGAAVDWATSHTATAAAVAAQINSTTSDPNYSATSSGAVVTIQALYRLGDSLNTEAITVGVGGDVTATTTAMAGGVDPDTSTPVERWRFEEDPETGTDRIEVWPVPNSADDSIYVFGKKSLTALAADGDTCLIDDELLVSTVAAPMLAREDKKDAQTVADFATRRYVTLKARGAPQRPPASFSARGSAVRFRRIAGTIIRIAG